MIFICILFEGFKRISTNRVYFVLNLCGKRSVTLATHIHVVPSSVTTKAKLMKIITYRNYNSLMTLIGKYLYCTLFDWTCLELQFLFVIQTMGIAKDCSNPLLAGAPTSASPVAVFHTRWNINFSLPGRGGCANRLLLPEC